MLLRYFRVSWLLPRRRQAVPALAVGDRLAASDPGLASSAQVITRVPNPADAGNRRHSEDSHPSQREG
jgi:hypothetical protein